MRYFLTLLHSNLGMYCMLRINITPSGATRDNIKMKTFNIDFVLVMTFFVLKGQASCASLDTSG